MVVESAICSEQPLVASRRSLWRGLCAAVLCAGLLATACAQGGGLPVDTQNDVIAEMTGGGGHGGEAAKGGEKAPGPKGGDPKGGDPAVTPQGGQGGAAATCGDGTCGVGEDCSLCPSDCGSCICHDECEDGPALPETCSACAKEVCLTDPVCCTTQWDSYCRARAEVACDLSCSQCSHAKCDMGIALDSGCDPCVEAVCLADPFCCTQGWDGKCVGLVFSQCGYSCPICPHTTYEEGTALSPTCGSCVTAVCSVDPFCCTAQWDPACVELAHVGTYDAWGYPMDPICYPLPL